MQALNSGVDLAIENLSLSFQSKKILDHFQLKIHAGEFVALLGASGSGKSTLLRLIAGLDLPSSGRIEVSSHATKSFVFQDANLLPWRNLRQNLELVFELGRREVDSRRIEEVVELVGLKEDLLKFPNQLSGGMKMRASVARALLNSPQLLLLDEPFSALDEFSRFRLQEELRSIWEQKRMTTIFVTHSTSEAVFLADRAVVIGERPARVILDHKIDVGDRRNSDLRNSPNYYAQIKILSESFSRA